jgi:microcystin-dependent protein
MAFWSWSKTPASNATADATINWAEGQSPSSVNDSARAMMARTAEWRDDVSGTITTGGTSTAYTVASNQGFDTLAHLNGAMIAFVPHTTNGGGSGTQVTLSVDGLAAKPIRTAPGADIQSGVLIQGTPYVVVYVNADNAFYLRNMPNPYGIPVGGLLPYIGSSAPNTAFALPFGQAISRTTYASLFALIGTTFGVGDGSTTFSLPDLRGRAIFGLDNMGGSAASRITVAGGNFNGTTLGATGGAENHALTQAEMPSHTHTATVTDPGHSHLYDAGIGGSNNYAGTIDAANTQTPSTHSATTGITVANASTGGGAAHSIMPPSMVLPFILRVI